ncbi:hypothetical protein COO91_03465 [Nostoc flagelliforme CCNUN1]|uniref:Uncharacterized protein n=1 Tax=Nostoc flagelliforme CCNUN1 TaxID=2038116 RepID=A0A2K8SQ99_9NOSO|nr:hypothetical protein COO91_03465 [Nostoc flagelliforme CCNUN1]
MYSELCAAGNTNLLSSKANTPVHFAGCYYWKTTQPVPSLSGGEYCSMPLSISYLPVIDSNDHPQQLDDHQQYLRELLGNSYYPLPLETSSLQSIRSLLTKLPLVVLAAIPLTIKLKLSAWGCGTWIWWESQGLHGAQAIVLLWLLSDRAPSIYSRIM